MKTFLAFMTGLFGGLTLMLTAFSVMACIHVGEQEELINELKEAKEVEA